MKRPRDVWNQVRIECFSIRSFGSWGEAVPAVHETVSPARVSVSALSDRGVKRSQGLPAISHRPVSVSALSDRGVKLSTKCVHSSWLSGFSIRSFGSWGEAVNDIRRAVRKYRFSIRSFGSWGEAGKRDGMHVAEPSFSIRSFGSWGEARAAIPAGGTGCGFSIRSFGSWGEA